MFGNFLVPSFFPSVHNEKNKALHLTLGTTWWFTKTEFKALTPCSLVLQNTLYLWIGRSECGGIQLSCTVMLVLLTHIGITDIFWGAFGGLGSIRMKNKSLRIIKKLLRHYLKPNLLTEMLKVNEFSEYPFVPFSFTAATRNWYQLPAFTTFLSGCTNFGVLAHMFQRDNFSSTK